MTNEEKIDKINKEIEPLTSSLRKLIRNAFNYHGINKDEAAKRIAQILKCPLKVSTIYNILNE